MFGCAFEARVEVDRVPRAYDRPGCAGVAVRDAPAQAVLDGLEDAAEMEQERDYEGAIAAEAAAKEEAAEEEATAEATAAEGKAVGKAAVATVEAAATAVGHMVEAMLVDPPGAGEVWVAAVTIAPLLENRNTFLDQDYCALLGCWSSPP